MSNTTSATSSASDSTFEAKSTVATTSSDTTKADQACDQSNGVNERRRFNLQMIQNVLLIWLDSNIDENDTDHCNTMV